MPIYEYQAVDIERGCVYCQNSFEQLEQISGQRMTTCPRCGKAVHQLISAPSVGLSVSRLDDRAKNAGFHKLKKLGTGEYEKQY